MRPSRSRLARLCSALSLLALFLFAAPVSAQEGGEGQQAPPETAVEDVEASAPDEEEEVSAVDEFFGSINGYMASVFFFDISFGALQSQTEVDGVGQVDAEGEPVMDGPILPLAVVILVLAAIFFTIRMGLPQLRSFGHAIDVIRGKYDDPDAKGEVSSFQALTAALSATVGLGNIGGVAIAVSTGGPGATFWMILAGFLGMASKFTECTLGQMYRETRPDGRIMGGAMYYLSRGLAERGFVSLGKVLAVAFAAICIGASFGGGNTFQVVQSMGAVKAVIPSLEGRELIYGTLMAIAVGIVILGGIKRIASTAEKIVPFMCGVYLLAATLILLMNFTSVPDALLTIVSSAFSPDAMFGGFLGVLIIGFTRAAFSNEAGIGSAAIAHSAARVPHPSREGIVALLEPFIDTIVVCTMTALVIVITGAYSPDVATFGAEKAAEISSIIAKKDGAALTSAAMGHELSFMPWVLAIAVILFAYSTMISWSYYGERCWAYLFGDGSSIVYRLVFVAFILLGSLASPGAILDFGDLLIFGMVLPNIIGVVMLSGKVKEAYGDYMSRLAAGEFKTFK